MQLIKSLTQNFFSGKCIKNHLSVGRVLKNKDGDDSYHKFPLVFQYDCSMGSFCASIMTIQHSEMLAFCTLKCLCIELCLTECYFLMVKLETPCSAGLESSDIRQPSWTLLCNIGIWKRSMWQKDFIIWGRLRLVFVLRHW